MYTLIVLAIGFFLGRWWERRKNKELGIKNKGPENQGEDAHAANSTNDQRHRETEEKKSRVLELARGKDAISNEDVEFILGVSDATATRYLDELEKEGKIVQVGKTGSGVTYKLNDR